MREIVDSKRVRAFLKALGDELASPNHDVLAMVRYGRVDPQKLLSFARQIAPGLIRHPAVDPEAFLQAVASFTASLKA